MKLETAERLSSKDVTEEELINAFQDDAARGEFIILSQSDQVFIQAAGEYDDPYLVEYRDGDDEHHFYAANDLPKERVQQLFIQYLAGNPSWHTDIEWIKQEKKPWWKFW